MRFRPPDLQKLKTSDSAGTKNDRTPHLTKIYACNLQKKQFLQAKIRDRRRPAARTQPKKKPKSRFPACSFQDFRVLQAASSPQATIIPALLPAEIKISRFCRHTAHTTPHALPAKSQISNFCRQQPRRKQ